MRVPETKEDTYNRIVLALTLGHPFAFSRFGDGEFNCIFGHTGANCDGHVYYPDLGRALRSILVSRPSYMVGIQPLAVRRYGERKDFQALAEAGNTHSEAFHHSNQHGDRLGMLFRALAVRPVVLVGPSYLRKLAAFPFQIVEVPEKNCWHAHGQVLSACEKYLGAGVVFVFCASMMAKVLIDELWRANPKCSYVDAGSAFDPHVGKATRRYHGLMMKDMMMTKDMSQR